MDNTPENQEEQGRLSSLTELLVVVKASGILSVIGLIVGIALAIFWAVSKGSDTGAFAALAIVVCTIMGGLFGSIGGASGYFAAKKLSTGAYKSDRWLIAGFFAFPSTLVMFLMTMQSLDGFTLLMILCITVLLALFAHYYVAPRLITKTPPAE